MFNYVDPAGRNFLSNQDAAREFRLIMQTNYESFARRPDSAFTWIEAFSDLSGGQIPGALTVDWRAFPITAAATDRNIDSNRLQFQDEYVEWMAERTGTKLTKVTFTTEFPEYFQAFAQVSFDVLKSAIQDVIPGANPTATELFGAGFDPLAASGQARAQSFRSNLAANPWNIGSKGFLCLTQRFNTLEALFNLLTECGVRQAGTPEGTCSIVGGACGPGRSSDPVICTESQKAVRAEVGYTLRDPAGIRIESLEGQWKLNGTVIDINDPAANSGIWSVTRNGRRAVLTIPNGLKLDDTNLTTGAQVSRKLKVVADLLTAPNASLPDWARISSESGSRGPA